MRYRQGRLLRDDVSAVDAYQLHEARRELPRPLTFAPPTCSIFRSQPAFADHSASPNNLHHFLTYPGLFRPVVWRILRADQRQLAVSQVMSSSKCLRRLAAGSVRPGNTLLRQTPRSSRSLIQGAASLRSFAYVSRPSSSPLTPISQQYVTQ
jgi:hypothetical protein